MSKNKKQRARREAKDNSRKRAQQTIPVAANKPLSAPRPAKAKPSSSTPQSKSKHSSSTPKPNSKTAVKEKEKTTVQASQKHEVPFGVYDKILLVGEGDFSFAHSLCMSHGCANVTATSFDNEEDVITKYPQFEKLQADLLDLMPPVPIHHGIDATKLSSYKEAKYRDEDGETAPWDTVAFMFPHTGGLSTDVNRQVRNNQALLVGFFQACLETKSTKPGSGATTATANGQTEKRKKDSKKLPFLNPGGRVIVTLFESAPYTLWNVRDLARHAGLKVVESYRFDWSQYPGYHHVRTLGTIEGGGGWKGEEREARMYVFEKPSGGDGDERVMGSGVLKENAARKKMRNGDGLKRGRESDEDEEDD